MPDSSSLPAVLADYDERTAHIMNALEDLKEVTSLIFDNFTGPNDVWVKCEFLQAVQTAEINLKRALP